MSHFAYIQPKNGLAKDAENRGRMYSASGGPYGFPGEELHANG